MVDAVISLGEDFDADSSKNEKFCFWTCKRVLKFFPVRLNVQICFVFTSAFSFIRRQLNRFQPQESQASGSVYLLEMPVIGWRARNQTIS